MKVQTSYTESEFGTLYVVPTPIGNLEDITFRAIQTLKKVNTIIAEDTRHTQKLLNHFQIKNKVLSYHEHNKKERAPQLLKQLKEKQDIAIVSDAGMPAISDPGHHLISEAIEKEINVVVLPGANAVLCALVGSGLPTNEFLFYGFLPRKSREKEAELSRLKPIKATILLYESPFRIKDTVRVIAKQLGNRHIVIAREITKIYEQYIRGNAEDVLQWVENNDVKGECCIVIEGDDGLEEGALWWELMSIHEHVAHYEQGNVPHKLALKKVANDRNISRRDVYQQIHVDKKD